MCSRPPSSPTIVGSAVDTIVWSSDASSITSISAPRTTPRRLPPLSLGSVSIAGVRLRFRAGEPVRRQRVDRPLRRRGRRVRRADRPGVRLGAMVISLLPLIPDQSSTALRLPPPPPPPPRAPVPCAGGGRGGAPGGRGPAPAPRR